MVIRNNKGQFIKGGQVNHSQETKNKISESLKLAHKRLSEWKGYFKKGHIGWNKNGFLSDETKKKISIANIGKIRSLETKKKQSEAAIKRGANKPRTGKIIICPICKKEKYKHPRDLKRVKQNYCSKKCAYKDFKGKNHSPNTQFKKGEHIGEKSWNWKGGITPIYNQIRGSLEYKLWQDSVFNRNCNYCQKCNENKIYKLVGHHIQNFSQYPELRFAIDNGITLCKDCHKKFHKIYGRRNNNQEQIDEFII